MELMDIAIKTIQDLQYRVGGNVVFLEAEDREKLLSFYENETNRFKRFDISVNFVHRLH